MKAGRQEFAETQSGDHIVFIYKDPAELFAFAVPFIRRGLANGERCAYVVAESSPAEVMDALSAGGVRVDRELKRGALVFTTPREYYGLPPFDATRAIERLREKLTEALDAGFAGLRAAGEMTWAGKRGVADEALGEYEDLLETFLGAGHLTIACLYRRDRFDPVVLQRLVRTHGKVVADHNVYLSLSALFRSLARQDLQGLSQAARERAVRKGGSYFRQGDRATEVYLLTAGLVKLVRTHPDGRSLVLRIVAPAEPFGDRVVAFADSVRLASAEAVQDSRALVWDGSTIRQIMLEHPTVAASAIRLLEARVEEERENLEAFAWLDARRRLARLLLRLAGWVGRKTRRGVVINVPLSRRDLAEMVMTSPYTVSRILSEWRRQDVVDALRAQIRIRDQERLASIAGVRASGAGSREHAG